MNFFGFEINFGGVKSSFHFKDPFSNHFPIKESSFGVWIPFSFIASPLEFRFSTLAFFSVKISHCKVSNCIVNVLCPPFSFIFLSLDKIGDSDALLSNLNQDPLVPPPLSNSSTLSPPLIPLGLSYSHTEIKDETGN